jgi:hypothetical protein
MQKGKSQEDFWSLFITNFSAERLQIYLKLSDGLPQKAQALYLWNAKTSSALWEIIGYLEVSLRNALDRQLTERSKLNDWLDDASIIKTNDPMRTLISQARLQATVYGRPPNHHQTLEQLPLGFLQALLSKKFLYLWPSLAAGFLGAGRGSHNEISERVKSLRRLRNRIGHHNHLLDLDIESEHANLMRIAQLVDPRLQRMFEIESRVMTLLELRPN